MHGPGLGDAARARLAVLPALLTLLASTVARAEPDCRALAVQRDQLAMQAMQAEIALLHGIRQRLCPRQEALASQSNALAAAPGGAAAVSEPVDFDAYIQCRQRAELQLRRSRPVLFRDRRGLPFYTPEGARLAREAASLQEGLDLRCPAPAAPAQNGKPLSR